MERGWIRVIDRTNEWIGTVAAFLMAVLTIEVVIGVIARYVFNRPLIWSQEVACFIMGVYILLGGGYCLRYKGHVNVDFFYKTLSDRGKAIADLFTGLLFFYFAILLVWEGGDMAWSSIQVKEHLAGAWRAPIYPFKIFLPIGGALLLAQGIAKFIRDLDVARGKKREDGGL